MKLLFKLFCRTIGHSSSVLCICEHTLLGVKNRMWCNILTPLLALEKVEVRSESADNLSKMSSHKQTRSLNDEPWLERVEPSIDLSVIIFVWLITLTWLCCILLCSGSPKWKAAIMTVITYTFENAKCLLWEVSVGGCQIHANISVSLTQSPNPSQLPV